jgi:hypothetical protein
MTPDSSRKAPARPDRELPDRHVPGRCRCPRACADRSGAVRLGAGADPDRPATRARVLAARPPQDGRPCPSVEVVRVVFGPLRERAGRTAGDVRTDVPYLLPEGQRLGPPDGVGVAAVTRLGQRSHRERRQVLLVNERRLRLRVRQVANIPGRMNVQARPEFSRAASTAMWAAERRPAATWRPTLPPAPKTTVTTRGARAHHQPPGNADPGGTGRRTAALLPIARDDRRNQRENAVTNTAHPGPGRASHANRRAHHAATGQQH